MPTLHFKGKTFVQNHHLAVKYYHLVPKRELNLMGLANEEKTTSSILIFRPEEGNKFMCPPFTS